MIPRNRRKGASLIELAVLIAAAAILFSVAIVVFNRILSMRRAGQEHLERTVQTARLAEQFRRDVWASKTFTLSESPPLLKLQSPDDREVEYRIDEGNLQRTELSKGKQGLRETLKIPGASVLQLAKEDSDGHARLSVSIASRRENAVEGEPTYGKPMRIAAKVGRDHAYGNREVSDEE
jgi:Tfp pilus assembly protein PilE